MQCGSCNVVLPNDARFCAACGQPIPGAPGPTAGAANTSKSMVTIVVVAAAMVLVAIVGIIAAIAIPNLLNAIDKAKQKRTVADMRSIGEAFEGYRADNRSYPAGDDLESLRSQLEPTYIGSLPMRDGWDHPFVVTSDGSAYQLISRGKDGISDGCDGGTTSNFNEDICFRDGAFNQWPEGVQQ